MVYCSVQDCHNSNDKKSKNKNKTVQFHRFPKDPELCKLWVEKCNKKIINTKNSRICSVHFDENSFTLKSRLLNMSLKNKKLNKNAIPTLLLPIEETVTERTKRAIKMARKKEINAILSESVE